MDRARVVHRLERRRWLLASFPSLLVILEACGDAEAALQLTVVEPARAFQFVAHNVPAGWRLAVEAEIAETAGVPVTLRRVTIAAIDRGTAEDLGREEMDTATLEARGFGSLVTRGGSVRLGSLFFPEQKPVGPVRVTIMVDGVDESGRLIEARATQDTTLILNP